MTTLRTLIVGAGRAGQTLARDLCTPEARADQELRPIGFVDDAAGIKIPHLLPHPLPHLGTLPELARLVTEHEAEAVILAIPSLPPARTRELTAAAIGAGAVVRYLPWYTVSRSRDITSTDLRPLDIRALIDGPARYEVSPEVKEIVTGKRVLVTGAADPLGSEICRQLNGFDPDELYLLDGTTIADRDQTDHTFRDFRPEVVFHAAGLRHASIVERRPSLAVLANVQTTDHLVRAAHRNGTERFVLISTDDDPTSGLASGPTSGPASGPASMLGATYRAAEAIIRSAAHRTGKHRTRTVFAAVRIGEVLDGRDSLLTVLPDQIRAGGPVTITHPDASRCFATAEEAVALALEAGRMATGGEVYSLDLGEPMRVAEVVSRFTSQYNLPEVPIRYAGPQRGQTQDPRPDKRIPTAQPQIFTRIADAEPADHAQLHECLDKVYKAAAKNRDPRVRQQLLKLTGPRA
ncbi:polysaccharide biosynthesis protein [Catenulispora pinisilvae]|uniref:polysaccharide biosynthesis protein n=1 Tax=Catenulispora pinisilvae TaxID=2705253 RepID=UPI001890FD1B|nr:polysaccharide biosynthesis protein [Catenulispora pinisilvae]